MWLSAAGMTFVYLCWPIRESNVFGVTAMAFGTALLLLAVHDRPHHASIRCARVRAVLEGLGRLSYELYLFHLIVLGVLRTIFPPADMTGSEKLVLLLAFLLVSICLSFAIARLYANPSNRIVRQWLLVRRSQSIRLRVPYS